MVEDDADSQVSNSTVGVRRQPVDVTEIADLQDDVRKADYRELARRLWRDCRDTGLKSALLIAVAPQSELATFAASLAIALADLRRGSVLLLDGDVRDRRLTTALQQAATPGWLNTLGASEVAAPPVVPTRTDGLQFMPAGQTERPLSPEDSGAIADAIRELTGRCDLLVVDGGALPALATELLAGACDVTYPVLSLGTTQVDDATAAVEQIRDAGGSVPGCFATHAPTS
jgi:Mrp family chromosome partitioning ATPase